MLRYIRTENMVDYIEFRVQDIRPEGYSVEIVDEKHSPLAGLSFQVSVDGESAGIKETDGNGMLKIPQPKTDISFSLMN